MSLHRVVEAAKALFLPWHEDEKRHYSSQGVNSMTTPLAWHTEHPLNDTEFPLALSKEFMDSPGDGHYVALVSDGTPPPGQFKIQDPESHLYTAPLGMHFLKRRFTSSYDGWASRSHHLGPNGDLLKPRQRSVLSRIFSIVFWRRLTVTAILAFSFLNILWPITLLLYSRRPGSRPAPPFLENGNNIATSLVSNAPPVWSTATPEGMTHKDSYVFAARLQSAFAHFTRTFNKAYATAEERAHRFEIFSRNLMYIDIHNAQKNNTYWLRANAFTDLTFEEFKTMYMKSLVENASGQAGRRHRLNTSLLYVNEATLPAHVDWREKGCVSEVKSQQKCGSCWAFSAAGSVEGAHCVKHNVLKSVSVQQMVDCAGPEGNRGCNGGNTDLAFQYIMDTGGLCAEEDYPYTAQRSRCKAYNCTRVVRVSEFVDVPPDSEPALRAAVANHGPISVSIEADELPFQFYHSGVFSAKCGRALNHAVLVVGYGVESIPDDSASLHIGPGPRRIPSRVPGTASQHRYWIIKNSWGTGWGESGYMRLSRDPPPRRRRLFPKPNKDDNDPDNEENPGECGVLLSPSYPLAL